MCVNKTHYRPATLDNPHNKTKVSMPKKIKYLIITFLIFIIIWLN
jgi:hypothetical protein